jgi:hypothetical protein
MICFPASGDDTERKTRLVLNCRSDISYILLDHFMIALSLFLFANISPILVKILFIFLRKKWKLYGQGKNVKKELFASDRLNAPIVHSRQRYRMGNGTIMLPREFFAKMKRDFDSKNKIKI